MKRMFWVSARDRDAAHRAAWRELTMETALSFYVGEVSIAGHPDDYRPGSCGPDFVVTVDLLPPKLRKGPRTVVARIAYAGGA